MLFDRSSGRRGSTPPPPQSVGARKVWVAGKPVPAYASATRRMHMAALASSRKYVWRYAITCGVLFLAAAVTRNPILAGVALLVGMAIVTFQLVRDATGHAHRDFFTGFALKHGLTYSNKMSLDETTPLLSAGDRRHCENYMEGPLRGANHVVGLSHYVYETREQRRDRRNRAISIYTPHWFTICVVDLPRVSAAFPGVFLSRRGGILGRNDWLDRPGLQTIELDAAMAANKYELLARSSQDRKRLLDLFQPSFQAWLVGLQKQIYFEFNEGTLVLYVPGKLRDVESLETMLLAAGRISTQFMREGEPLHVVSPSIAPPGPGSTGRTGEFPPPPPATKPIVEAIPSLPLRSRIGSASVPPPGA